jgi:hypothetical protein
MRFLDSYILFCTVKSGIPLKCVTKLLKLSGKIKAIVNLIPFLNILTNCKNPLKEKSSFSFII